MTHRIDELNPLDACFMVAREYPGGLDAMAARMGAYSRVIRKKLGRDQENRPLHLDEFSEIIDLGEAARCKSALLPMRALAWRHGGVFLRLPDADALADDGFMLAVIHTAKEQGDVIRKVEEALADDARISPSEVEQIDAEIEEAIAALVSLREAVRIKAGVRK